MLRLIFILGLARLISLPCLGQSDPNSQQNKPASQESAEAASKAFYQLGFVVQEVESERVVNTRSYTMIVQGKERSAVRAGEKVPFSIGGGATTEWTQINVGVEIDCWKLEAIGNRVSLNIKAQISSVMEGAGENKPPGATPIIRNNQWESAVTVPMRQSSVLFSSDDPASKRTMRLVLTVTPIR